jgi:hypothetical protein
MAEVADASLRGIDHGEKARGLGSLVMRALAPPFELQGVFA